MQTRNVIITLLLMLLLFAAFVLKRFREPAASEIINRHPAHLIYTKHARCRMNCRHIDEAEIQEILEGGVINFNKSDKKDGPCPTVAMQGLTKSGESIRVIFAQCPTETKVVTCYNLKEDFECQCPGDEAKN